MSWLPEEVQYASNCLCLLILSNGLDFKKENIVCEAPKAFRRGLRSLEIARVRETLNNSIDVMKNYTSTPANTSSEIFQSDRASSLLRDLSEAWTIFPGPFKNCPLYRSASFAMSDAVAQ